MSVSFRNAQHGLAYARGGELRRTIDGGQTWTPVTYAGPMRLAKVTAVPGSAGSYISVGLGQPYIAGDQLGSALTTDDGNTWQNLENAIPYSSVVARDVNSILAVAGLGRNAALYRYTGTALATMSRQSQPATFYPNPTTGILQLESKPTARRLQLFDTTGRLIYDMAVPAHAVRLDLSALRKGLYEVKMLDQSNNSSQLGKLLLMQ